MSSTAVPASAGPLAPRCAKWATRTAVPASKCRLLACPAPPRPAPPRQVGNQNCSVERDLRDAAAVCRQLGVPLHEADFVAQYWTRVGGRDTANGTAIMNGTANGTAILLQYHYIIGMRVNGWVRGWVG